MTAAEIFLMLCIGHALADFPLQGDYLARAKNRHDEAGRGGIWVSALLAHALIHAGAVWLATGSLGCALCELIAHTAIDYLRCEKAISYHQDQALHIGCKLLYVL